MKHDKSNGTISTHTPLTWNPDKPILIVTSVSSERNAVLSGLQGDPRFEVITGGVGQAAAAASTAKALASADYGLVICAGIGGGFPGAAEAGTLVVATDIVAADLGVETPEGFASIDELGFGPTRIEADAGLASKLTAALAAANLLALSAPVLTVSTATGTAASAAKLAARVPGAAAEAMEGFGAAVAARNSGLPILELRAVSNPVGPRDRAAWKIEEALDVLRAASQVLSEVLA